MRSEVLVFCLLIFSFNSCSSQKLNKIKKVSFYTINMNVENPNNLQNQFIVTEFYKDSIYKLKEFYKDDTLLSVDTIKLVSKNNDALFEKIQNVSDSFSSKDMSFGEVNIADEGALGITITFDNNEQNFWQFGILDKNVDPRIKEIYDYYEAIEQNNVN